MTGGDESFTAWELFSLLLPVLTALVGALGFAWWAARKMQAVQARVERIFLQEYVPGPRWRGRWMATVTFTDGQGQPHRLDVIDSLTPLARDPQATYRGKLRVGQDTPVSYVARDPQRAFAGGRRFQILIHTLGGGFLGLFLGFGLSWVLARLAGT